MIPALFIVFGLGLFLGFWMGKKEAQELDEVELLQERIITELEGYLRSKPTLTSFEASLKTKLSHLREIW